MSHVKVNEHKLTLLDANYKRKMKMQYRQARYETLQHSTLHRPVSLCTTR